MCEKFQIERYIWKFNISTFESTVAGYESLHTLDSNSI